MHRVERKEVIPEGRHRREVECLKTEGDVSGEELAHPVIGYHFTSQD